MSDLNKWYILSAMYNYPDDLDVNDASLPNGEETVEFLIDGVAAQNVDANVFETVMDIYNQRRTGKWKVNSAWVIAQMFEELYSEESRLPLLYVYLVSREDIESFNNGVEAANKYTKNMA